MMDKVRGAYFAIMLLLSSYLGIIFMPGWFLPLAFLRPAWYRKIADICLGWWMWLAAAVLELVCGIDMVVTGDEVQADERSLIIMNHRTRLDWLYFWSVLVRQSGPNNEKIILKRPLNMIPGAGWAMQCGAFMFLKRNWEADQSYLRLMMDYFAAIGHKTQVLLFPEGTNLTTGTKKRSDDFADKNSLAKYDYVLHPRTTGFTFLAEYMKEKAMLDCVYDVTVGYPCNIPSNEIDIIKGNFPQQVHFHVERISLESLPSGEEALREWCNERWRLKEDKLKEFYEKKQFAKQNTNNADKDKYTMLVLCLALVYWSVFILCAIYCLIMYWQARWILIIQTVFFIFMSMRGGFEKFQADHVVRVLNYKPRLEQENKKDE